MPKSKRGFTLIELLIVIAIIIVLAAMLVLGMKHVLKSGKEAATKLTLSNLQAMLADLDGKTRLSTAPAAWTWYENATAATLTINAGVATTGKTVDFWHIPASFPAGTRSYDTLYDAMDAPGVVTESDSISQNGCRAILNTEFAMQLIMGLPANRSAIEKLSPNQLFLPEATGATFHSPGPQTVSYTQLTTPLPNRLITNSMPSARTRGTNSFALRLTTRFQLRPRPAQTHPAQIGNLTPLRSCR